MTVHEVERRVVVAYDGDDSSRDALLAAAEEAALHNALLDVVYVVDLRPIGALAALPEYADDAHAAGTRALNRVPALMPSGVRFTTRVEDGDPGRVLVQAAQGARLLVVGSRSHSIVAGVVLGSVTLHCVMHAPCPVLVVPVNSLGELQRRTPTLETAL